MIRCIWPDGKGFEDNYTSMWLDTELSARLATYDSVLLETWFMHEMLIQFQPTGNGASSRNRQT